MSLFDLEMTYRLSVLPLVQCALLPPVQFNLGPTRVRGTWLPLLLFLILLVRA